MSRKIFIDAGAYNGDSIDAFRKMRSDADEFEIYAFEPNPAYKIELDAKDVIVIEKAVWIEDGYVDFYIGEHDGTGSTLIKGKTSGEVNYKAPQQTLGVDFNNWIKETFDPNDYIIVKMDIEGAEFEVIPHMMEGESILYISQLWCEFHPNKLPQYTTKDKTSLIKKIKAYEHLLFKDWH